MTTKKENNHVKKFLLLLTVVLLCGAFLLGLWSQPGQREYKIAEGNKENFSRLLSDLLKAYETPSAEDSGIIAADLDTIAIVNRDDRTVADRIAKHWQRVYLDPDYELKLYQGGEFAPELESEGIRNTDRHAIVVLGYELKNGEMTDELKGRCDAAAAAARTFPKTILVCSGGATGANNPDRHTEAGMMKEYLTDVCGIDASRIFTDESAMTTADNAVNSLEIMREKEVQGMTIVTSSYHQRWGQVLYNAVAAAYQQQFGYAPEIIGNYCYDISPENEAFANDAKIAISQLRGILGVPGNPGIPRP